MAKKTLKELKEEKVASVMREYKDGTLHSGGSGKVVKDRKTAIAISLSEASKVKLPKKKK